MKVLRCLFIFTIIHFSLKAQQDIDSGYILAQNQDTIRGLMKVSMESDLSTNIQFKKTGTEGWKSYGPADISGYGIGNDIYKSMRFINAALDSVWEKAFVKQLVTGEFNLFVYMKPDGRFYLIQKDTALYFLFSGDLRVSGDVEGKGNYQSYLSLISINCEKFADQYDRVSYNDKAMSDFILKELRTIIYTHS